MGRVALFDKRGTGLTDRPSEPPTSDELGLALSEAGSRQGLEVRIGIHSGEVADLEGDLAGLAVHLGARVAAKAEMGRVWVSQTVRDLLIGSEFHFISRGRHLLKGVPGDWELYMVER